MTVIQQFESRYREQLLLIEQGKCPLCSELIDSDEFRDEESKHENHITGLCQQCQDRIYSRKEEEYDD